MHEFTSSGPGSLVQFKAEIFICVKFYKEMVDQGGKKHAQKVTKIKTFCLVVKCIIALNVILNIINNRNYLTGNSDFHIQTVTLFY